MTDLEFQAWLEDDTAMRVILADIGVLSEGSEITRYLSTKGYNLADGSILYNPIIQGGIQLSESLDIDGDASLSYGDLEFANYNGEYDTWLDDIWQGRTITVRLGDVRWDKADFRIILDGVCDSMTSRSRDLLNLRIRDKLERLNTPVSEAKLDNYWHGSIVPTSTYDNANKDSIKPLVFGEAHNISPLLIDPTMLEFMVSDGAVEAITEVRDNGVPIAANVIPDLANGKFKLSVPNAGTITASVQGIKKSSNSLGAATSVYENSVAKLIFVIVTQYGKAATRFTASDIDLASFNTFHAAYPIPAGVYLEDRTNVLQACQDLAYSAGASLVMSRQGKLRLIKIGTTGTSTRIINPDHMHLDSFQIGEVLNIAAAVKLGYAKNWTMQPDLITGIPTEHKDLFNKEWLSINKSDTTVATNYKLDVEPEQEDSLLITEADADAIALERLELRSNPRRIYTFTGVTELMQLEIGQLVTLIHPRFGLSAGKTGQIVSLEPDWMKSSIEVGVLV